MTSTRGSVTLQVNDGSPVAVLVGEIDQAVLDSMSDAEFAAFETDGEIVVDVTNVTFMDSTGLSFLLRLRHVATSVCLLRPPHTLTRLLELTGTSALFRYNPAPA